MKQLLVLIFTFAMLCAHAQPQITNTTLTQTASNAYRYLVTFDTDVNAKAYVKAVNTTNTNVPETHSYITDENVSHQVYYQGFIPNDTYEIYAVAFDTIGETQELVGTVIGDANYGLEITVAPDTSAAFTGKELTFSTPKPDGESGEKLLVWMDVNGGITRIIDDGTANSDFDCNNHYIDDTLIVVVSCDSVNFYNNSDFSPISSKVNLEDSVVYHGKPILNEVNNLVFLNAHSQYVDKSFLPGGMDSTLMVSDGFMEYDFINNTVENTWNAISGFNPFQTVWLNGIYESKFPGAESWRLSNCLALGIENPSTLSKDVIINHSLEQQVAEVSVASSFPNFNMPSYNVLIAPADEHSDVRDFTTLDETGLYFTMANRYDSLITRCIEGFIMPDYQTSMYVSVRDYRLPADEWTPGFTGGGLKIPSADFHKAVMISGANRISQVDETDVVEWTVDLNNSAIPLSFVTAYFDIMNQGDMMEPVVEIFTIDSLVVSIDTVFTIDTIYADIDSMIIDQIVTTTTIVENLIVADTVQLDGMIFCNDSSELIQIVTSVDGGYFSGVAIEDGVINIADLDTGEYQLIYTYGYVSDTVTFTIEECVVNITELYEMGGIISSIYPNPVSNNATIRFELVEFGPVELQIFNLQGSLIKNEDLGMQMSGMNRISIDVSDLNDGSYIYRLISNNMSSQETFVIVK